MYRLISKIMPVNIKNNFKDLLRYANIKRDPEIYLGFIIVFSLLSSILISLLLNNFFKVNLIISFLIPIIIIPFILYFPFVLIADKRSMIIEKYLPDALQLMSSNLRAGLTIDRALLLSTRPEFGILRDEINLVGKQITMGKSLNDALLESAKRIRSKTYEKTILLIVSGLKSGGELVSLLEETADNLTQKKLVDKKVRSSINLYVIFIIIALVFGAPILFGLSSYLIGVLTNILSQVQLPESTNVKVPFSISKNLTIDENYIINFSLLFLTLNVILGSLVLGLITKGKEKYGVNYIIPMLIVSISLFFIIRFLISQSLGGSFITK